MSAPSPSERLPAVHETVLRGPAVEVRIRYSPMPGIRRFRRHRDEANTSLVREAKGILLGIQGRSVEGREPIPLETLNDSLDLYTRSQETVLESAATGACPIRMQAYWQIGEEHVDLQVLVASDHPVSEVAVQTQTRLAAEQVLLSMKRNDKKGFECPRRHLPPEATGLAFSRRAPLDNRLLLQGPDAETAEVSFEAALLVFRLAGGESSYVEMAHVEDIRQLAFAWHDKVHEGSASGKQTHEAGEIETGFRLFGGPLEKGVILRTRLRAALLSREGDLERASELYEQFLAEPPPLAV